MREKEISEQLMILYEGESVKDVYAIQIKIVNSGNLPIQVKDYVQPISVKFGANSKVLVSEVSDCKPSELEISLTNTGAQTTIQSVLLNQSDSFTVRALVSDYTLDDEIKVMGRITGVRKIKTLRDPLRIFVIIAIICLAVAILCVIVGSSLSAQRSIPPPPTIERIIIAIMSVSFFSAAFAVGRLMRIRMDRRIIGR